MTDKIRNKKIVIIGSSQIIKDHIRVFNKIKLNIVAIASSRLKSKNCKLIAKQFNIKKVYNNWSEMLDQELFDGIVIASKIEKTYKIMECALKFNKPILVEKPISLNSIQIKKLMKHKNKKIIVGYNRRHYESVIFLKNYINKIKEKTLINVNMPEIQNIKSIFSNSIHTIDLIHFIFGNLKILSNKKIFNKKKLLGFQTLFKSKNGHLINLTGNLGASDNFSINVYLKNMKLTLCPLEILTIYKGLEIKKPTKFISVKRYNPKVFKIIYPKDINKKFKPGFYKQASEFFNLMNNAKTNINNAKIKDSYNNILLCEKILGRL